MERKSLTVWEDLGHALTTEAGSTGEQGDRRSCLLPHVEHVRDLAGLAFPSPSPRTDHDNLTEALSAAGEMEHVGLVEALELCLLILDRAPGKCGRAALRWEGRYCREVRDVTLEEAQAVLATLALLPKVREREPARSQTCATGAGSGERERL